MLSIELENALLKSDRLIGQGQFDSAIIYLDHLKEYYPDPLEKILIEIDIAWCLESKENFEESQEEFLRLLESTLLLSDTKYSKDTIQKTVIKIYHGLTTVDARLENIESAFLWAQKSLVESIVIKDNFLISASNYYLALVHFYISQYDKIFILLDKSIGFIRESADRKLLGKTLILYGIAYEMTGDLDTSLKFFTEVRKLYEDLGDFRNLSTCLNNMSVVYRYKGEYQISLRLLKKVEIMTEDQGRWHLSYHVLDNITEILLLTGEIAEARITAQKLVQLARNNHLQSLIGKALGILAQIEQHTNLDVARDLFEEAIILLQTTEVEMDLLDCVNRYLKFLIKVEDYENALFILNKYEKIIEDKQLNVYRSDFLLAKGLIESNQNLNLGLANEYYQKSLKNANSAQLLSIKIKSYIYLAENTLEKYQIKPSNSFLKIARGYISEAYDLALTRSLYPDIASINLLRSLLFQLTGDFNQALKIMDETLALTRNKGLKLQEAQANALKNKLKEISLVNSYLSTSKMSQDQITSEFDSTRALISTIRIFYHEDLSHLMPHKNQLAVVFYSLTELGPVSKYEDFSPMARSEYNMSDAMIDEILLVMGSTYSIAVGQGNNYQEGLFGPLPVPRMLETYALVYSKDLSNEEEKNEFQNKENNLKQFGFLCFVYPKEFDILFFDRDLLSKEFSQLIDVITSSQNKMNDLAWKSDLLKSVDIHFISNK